MSWKKVMGESATRGKKGLSQKKKRGFLRYRRKGRGHEQCVRVGGRIFGLPFIRGEERNVIT